MRGMTETGAITRAAAVSRANTSDEARAQVAHLKASGYRETKEISECLGSYDHEFVDHLVFAMIEDVCQEARGFVLNLLYEKTFPKPLSVGIGDHPSLRVLFDPAVKYRMTSTEDWKPSVAWKVNFYHDLIHSSALFSPQLADIAFGYYQGMIEEISQLRVAHAEIIPKNLREHTAVTMMFFLVAAVLNYLPFPSSSSSAVWYAAIAALTPVMVCLTSRLGESLRIQHHLNALAKWVAPKEDLVRLFEDFDGDPQLRLEDPIPQTPLIQTGVPQTGMSSVEQVPLLSHPSEGSDSPMSVHPVRTTQADLSLGSDQLGSDLSEKYFSLEIDALANAHPTLQ